MGMGMGGVNGVGIRGCVARGAEDLHYIFYTAYPLLINDDHAPQIANC
jgi:hypothetical protein